MAWLRLWVASFSNGRPACTNKTSTNPSPGGQRSPAQAPKTFCNAHQGRATRSSHTQASNLSVLAIFKIEQTEAMTKTTKPYYQPKTKFHLVNPFTGEKTDMATAIKKIIKPEELELCDDPLPEHKKAIESKYSKLFEQVYKTGKAVKCESALTSKIGAAARKWCDVHTKNAATVRSTIDYGDGKGRVWILKKSAVA